MKYFKITMSSRIDKILDNLIYDNCEGVAGVKSIALPNTVTGMSTKAVYECENIQSLNIGGNLYCRPNGYNIINVKLGGKTVTEQIKHDEPEPEQCAVLPFALPSPLC